MGSTVSLSLSKGDDDCGRDYHTGWRQICWLVMALDEAGEEKLNTRTRGCEGCYGSATILIPYNVDWQVAN
jgi:hypothetical protein